VIGKGASAEVYKVVMANGQTVAVKRCAVIAACSRCCIVLKQLHRAFTTTV